MEWKGSYDKKMVGLLVYIDWTLKEFLEGHFGSACPLNLYMFL